jgi:circadian clock protein KaiB
MSRRTIYKFRLYIAGDAPNSAQAQNNLTALCETYLLDRYEIEVVDVLKMPMVALQDNVLMTPTLLKLAPAPVRKIVGTLSQMQTVLNVLGLEVIVA